MNVEDIGPLPTRPSPAPGHSFTLRFAGEPPVKTIGRSMRNASSPQYPAFLALRRAAIDAMAGRRWYEGLVGLYLTYEVPDPPSIHQRNYLGGIMDTLGASQGPTFVYLPIVYIDDGQVADTTVEIQVGPKVRYALTIAFLPLSHTEHVLRVFGSTAPSVPQSREDSK
jgi:hypothetical protein